MIRRNIGNTRSAHRATLTNSVQRSGPLTLQHRCDAIVNLAVRKWQVSLLRQVRQIYLVLKISLLNERRTSDTPAAAVHCNFQAGLEPPGECAKFA